MPLRADDPEQIGGYRLTARLGAGGMGLVYLCEAPDGGLVAVKVLRPELADDPEFRRRFQREVSVLTKVKGVCTVRVIEADTESVVPYMVTEFINGPNLAEYVDRHGPLGADMLYGLATGLAEALTVIHAAGIVHRDLKPSNVILAADGPKVIDFGIAQTLDATAVTKTGMMVGSAGFMAPEQVLGKPGPLADVFVWGVTIGYAASGESPFGGGPTEAVLYRVLHNDPDISAVPESLRPLVTAALAKDERYRPSARQLLDRLTNPSAAPVTTVGAERQLDSPTQTVLALTWRTGPMSAPPPATRATEPIATDPGLLKPAAPGTDWPAPAPAAAAGPDPSSPGLAPERKGPVSRRTVSVGVAVLAVAAAAILAVVLLTGHSGKSGSAAGQSNQNTLSASTLPTYQGQQGRGVFQTIDRIAAWGKTIVTTGSLTSNGVARQQFFVSSDGGATWHLAPVQLPGGGEPPVGFVADRIAAGPTGWLAWGPQVIWTSQNGLSWTLAATHGIEPRLPSDQVFVLTSTSTGFVAGGQGKTSAGGNQGLVWVSHDGITWQRMTAAEVGMTLSGQPPQAISYAATRGNDTVISDGGSGVWLSTDGGSSWTTVSVPVDHGAKNTISGLSSDGSGLLAVRPGTTASGAPDGVAYFSPNGQTWQFSGLIDPAGGWTPGVVKGSNDGFVVTGTASQNIYVAYTSPGPGSTWHATGSLGDTSGGPVPTAAAGPHGVAIIVGATTGTKLSQQPVFLEADAAGTVRSVAISGIPGSLIPEAAVNSTAVADGEQVAVGSADGYPAIWRRALGTSSWTLVSPLSLVSGPSDLAALSSVTHGPAGWVAAGTPGPVIFTSANGITWQPAGGNIQQDLAGVAAVAIASGPSGYLIDGKLVGAGGVCVADDWFSTDLTSWTRAHTAIPSTGSSQVLAVAAGPHGFVTAGSHNGQPAIWTTANGTLWTTDVLPQPTGASGALLQQVAINGDIVVALGQQTTVTGTLPLAELSTDGGKTWQQVQFVSAGQNTTVTALTAGPGGFIAAGQFGNTGQQGAAIWRSPDGTSWTQLVINGLTGGGSHDITTVSPSGSAVTAIDSILSTQNQQYVTVPVPAH
ncbi:MAG: protein kinase domain-containing protein [Streptosporangiaceae bacterium]